MATIQGTSGDDTLIVRPGDVVDTDGGNDTITISPVIGSSFSIDPRAVISAGDGNDTIIDQSAKQDVFPITGDGGDGDDAFVVTGVTGGGATYLTGGPGHDLFEFSTKPFSNQAVTITDFSHDDMIKIDTNTNFPPTITITNNGSSIVLEAVAAGGAAFLTLVGDFASNQFHIASDGQGNAIVTYQPKIGSGGFSLTPDYAFRNYVAPDSSGVANGTTGNDDIFATADGQTLIGNGGGDIFHLGTYFNIQLTVPPDGSGIDEVSTYAASYTLPALIDNLAAAGDYPHTLIGNDGDNVIIGAGGNDILMGDGGSNWLMGGGGNDVLYGGPGPDILDGGAGSDRFIITAGGGNQDIENFQPGTGGDVVDLTNYGYTSFDQVRAAMTTNTSSDGTILGTLLHLANGETLTFDGFDLSHPFTTVPGPSSDQFIADNFNFDGSASVPMGLHTMTVSLAEDAMLNLLSTLTACRSPGRRRSRSSTAMVSSNLPTPSCCPIRRTRSRFTSSTMLTAERRMPIVTFT